MYAINDLFKNYIPGLVGPEKVLMSSIIIPIVVINGEQNIIFQVRSSKLRSQPGEVAFPGGKLNENELPIVAAEREFCEEMNCDKSMFNIVSQFDSYFAASRGLIYCFIAEVDSSIDFNIKNTEVDEVFFVPIKYFIENEPDIYTNKIQIFPDDDFPFEKMSIPQTYNWGIQKYPVIFYNYKGYIIWGITANITRNFVNKLVKMT